MNEHFINVKVDREERPDVDRMYMEFLQASTGGGGWPMSVWLTPDLHPFFAGTYYPPGQFRLILSKLSEVWEDDQEKCIESGKNVIEQMKSTADIAPEGTSISISKSVEALYTTLAKTFDTKNGGFGSAPKFPTPSQTMHFLARYASLGPPLPPDSSSATKEKEGEREKGEKGEEGDAVKKAEVARDMAVTTLIKIYNGGIRDVVGGGFARYSVDDHWHVPHFEKMLYDQAQLLTSALEISLLLPPSSPDRRILQTMAQDTITYVSRDLLNPQGAFYSAEDADSFPTFDDTKKKEKKTKEGAFYVWTAQDIDRVLGEDKEVFKYHFGVRWDGNCDPRHDIQGELTGQNVLFTAHTIEETAKKFVLSEDEVQSTLKQSLTKLKEVRDRERPRPHLDDKILTCWNGLMISGLSKASEWLDDQAVASQALELAKNATAFIRKHLYDEESGKLYRSYREGVGPIGQADDYAFLIQGLLDLYEASGMEEYVSWAIKLQEKQDELFYDTENGGGYFVSAPDDHILVRWKYSQDGAEPSAISISSYNLHRLSHLAEDRYTEYIAKAEGIIKSNSQLLSAAPRGLGTLVSSGYVAKKGYRQFIVVGDPAHPKTQEFICEIRRQFMPGRVLIHLDPKNPPLGLAKVNGTVRSLVGDDGSALPDEVKPNVRICENFRCGLPIYDVDELKKVLEESS